MASLQSTSINGSLTTTGDITAFYSSDARLKEKIQIISDALDKVALLDGITFNWNESATDKNLDVREAGVIAQQVQQVLPEVVTEREDGHLAVSYEKIIPLLIEAIKELKKEVDEIKNS